MTINKQAATVPQKWAHTISCLAITAWVGCLWGVGLLAVPVLFHNLPDKMLAGMLAGKMFTLVAYVGMASACYLMAYLVAVSGRQSFRQPLFLITSAMLLLALASEFGLQPEMAALKTQALPAAVMDSPFSTRFDLLHRIATGIYLAECLLGAALVLKAKRC
jgi:hypothetical protein